MKKILKGTLLTLSASAFILSATLVLMPAPVQAQNFSAGDFDSGICSCPVTVGNCVCKFTPPPV